MEAGNGNVTLRNGESMTDTPDYDKMIDDTVKETIERSGLERDQFIEQATAGDYNALLRVCMEWVNVS